MSRINTNLRAVERLLVREGVKDVLVDEILDAMNKTEFELCRDYGAIENTFTLATVASQEQYTIPVGPSPTANVASIVAFQRPSAWSTDPDFTTDPKVYARHKAEVTTGTQPLLILIREGKLFMNPAPSAIVTLTFRAYMRPTQDMAEYSANPDVEDPSVSQDWDRALQLGAMDKILPGSKYAELYKDECRKVSSADINRQQITPISIRYSANRIGF